jgi:hypothetical protein
MSFRQQRVNLCFIGIPFLVNFLFSAPMVLIKNSYGPVYYRKDNAWIWIPGVEGEIQNGIFKVAVGYQNYHFEIPASKIPSDSIFTAHTYYVDAQELPITMGINYAIINYQRLTFSLHPAFTLLFNESVIRSEGLIPSKLIEEYWIENSFFFGLTPKVALHYNVPNTNLWLGFDCSYNYYINCQKAQNKYLALIFSFAFELFQR